MPTIPRADVLGAMVEVAKVQSAKASNSIEGIRASDKRLKAIVVNKTDLRSRATGYVWKSL